MTSPLHIGLSGFASASPVGLFFLGGVTNCRTYGSIALMSTIYPVKDDSNGQLMRDLMCQDLGVEEHELAYFFLDIARQGGMPPSLQQELQDLYNSSDQLVRRRAVRKHPGFAEWFGAIGLQWPPKKA